jgi:hypothetical protein
MKITKTQLRKLIREELQNERVTPEQAADPNFNYAQHLKDRYKDPQPSGEMSRREKDALFGEMVGEIEMLINGSKGIKAPPHVWASKLFDQIEAILAKRKG